LYCICNIAEVIGGYFVEEWDKIPLETIQILDESIARRIEAVLKSNGGPKPY
jgi:hypothetical protein